MLDWIAANTANIIIIAILVAVVTLVIIKLVRDKKAGRSACGGKCSGCAMGGCCGSGGDAEQRVKMKAEFQRCRDFSLFQHDLELAAGGGIDEDAKLVTVGGNAAEVVAQALARVGRAER